MLKLDQNPVASLLEVRRQREDPVTLATWTLVLVGFYGLPAVAMGLADHASGVAARSGAPVLTSSLGAFLVLAGFLVLLAVPWLAFRVDAALLMSFRRGRCFEEILGTPTTATEVVDGVLLHTLRSLARIAIPAAAALAPALVLAAPELQGAYAVAGALWAVACVATVLVISILILLFASWSHHGEELTPLLALALLATLGPAAGLVVAAFARPEGPSGTWGMLLVGLALAWTVASGRSLSLYGFAHFYDLDRAQRRLVRSLSGGGQRHLLAWSDNPIVRRECGREARALPDFWPLQLLVRHSPVLVAAVLLLAPWKLPLPLDTAERFWVGLALACGFLALRAAGRTVDLLVDEREGQTWEALLGSRLSLQELLSGWAEVGWVPRATDGLLLSPLAVWLALEAGRGAEAIAVPFLLVTAPLAGAYAGLWSSLEGGRRREATRNLALPLLFPLVVALGLYVAAIMQLQLLGMAGFSWPREFSINFLLLLGIGGEALILGLRHLLARAAWTD